jgi:hypothetical protein
MSVIKAYFADNYHHILAMSVIRACLAENYHHILAMSVVQDNYHHMIFLLCQLSGVI